MAFFHRNIVEQRRMDASWMQDAKYSAYWARQQSLGQENFFFILPCKQKWIVSVVKFNVRVRSSQRKKEARHNRWDVGKP